MSISASNTMVSLYCSCFPLGACIGTFSAGISRCDVYLPGVAAHSMIIEIWGGSFAAARHGARQSLATRLKIQTVACRLAHTSHIRHASHRSGFCLSDVVRPSFDQTNPCRFTTYRHRFARGARVAPAPRANLID